MNEAINIRPVIYRIISLIMVVLVMSISVVQIFHSHTDDHHPIKTGEKEYTQAIEKCDICDFLVHKQQKEFLLPGSQQTEMPQWFSVAKPMTGSVNFYKFTLPGFTNKGPPAALSFC